MLQALKQSLYPKAKAAGGIQYLVVGLGNPESKYAHTRHNTGWLALDHIAQKAGTTIDRMKFHSLCADVTVEGQRLLLMKPLTYMNNSGEAVQEAAAFYKIPPERCLIIFDDISLDVGKMRIRRQGSDGGHNGIKSIIQLCGSQNFPRIKVGIGHKPNPAYDLADWVLSRFSPEELKTLEGVFDNCWESLALFLEGKLDRAMNLYNS